MFHFQPEFFQFLKALEENNNRDWFTSNKKRYEQDLKEPFEDFAKYILDQLLKIDNELLPESKKCIFRINRDIRFSKDKTPYKTNRSLAFSKLGKKDTENPGYYIELNHKKCFLAGGAYLPSKENLKKIRQEIYYQIDEFENLVSKKEFIDYFGELKGSKAKRLTGIELEYASQLDIIYQKQYYFYTEFEPELCLKPDFSEYIISLCEAGLPINQFLRRAIRDNQA